MRCCDARVSEPRTGNATTFNRTSIITVSRLNRRGAFTDFTLPTESATLEVNERGAAGSGGVARIVARDGATRANLDQRGLFHRAPLGRDRTAWMERATRRTIRRIGNVAADEDTFTLGRVSVIELGHDREQCLGVGVQRPLVERLGVAEFDDLTQVHPVSYTHLRAHETVLDLVCRLLLEK